MTRVRIAPPDTEEDVSAEQVAAYLLARGWEEEGGFRTVRWFTRGQASISMPSDPTWVHFARDLAKMIVEIAHFEGNGRHPSAVLADIVGPARAASVGASCRGEESRASILARARCRVKMSLAHSQAERAEQEAKRAEREALLGYAETADDDNAARGAGESEE